MIPPERLQSTLRGGIQRLKLLSLIIFASIAASSVMTHTSIAADMDDMTGGEAYVDGFQVKEQKDGIGPFDDDDDAGNDSSDSNLIVRSFDSINYMLEYTTELVNQSQPATKGASLYATFILPMSQEKARFNLNAMNWIVDKRLVYSYSDGTESETLNKTKTVVKQTLTGKRILENKSSDDRVPGAGQLSVGILVKAAENGVKIHPEFKLRCSGTTIEKKCEAKTVTVSAAPRYNIEVKGNDGNTARNIIYADSNTGDVQIQDKEGLTKGRIYGRSVALALWNTSADKGLKGIELPQGDITYDITTTATLDNQDSTDNGDFGVSLWDYKENNLKDTGHLKRKMAYLGEDRARFGAYNSVINSLRENNDTMDSAYEGGTISAITDSKNPAVMHVTISGYQFDTDNFVFPSTVCYYEKSNHSTFPANIGYFSVGYFQYLARFPRQVDSTKNFFVKTAVDNFHVRTKSGAECTTEMKANDNVVTSNVVLYAPGSFSKYSYFDGARQSSWASGDGWGIPGEDNRGCFTRISYSGSDPLQSVDVLMKIDTKALEVRKNTSVTTFFPATTLFNDSNIQTLYAVKPDGNGWDSDDEMQSTRQEQLLYFNSYDALIASKKTCVAVLYRMRNVQIYATRDCPQFNMHYHVKDNAENGYVAQVIADVRAWKIPNPGESIIGTNSDGSIGTVMDSDYGNTKWVNGYTKPDFKDYTPYKKRTYANGTISGGHTNGIQGGDSLLIVTANNRINIEVDDKTGNATKKETYDLDAGERTTTFKVSPAIDLASANQSTTGSGAKGTAQVTVTLPVGLTYKSSSIEPTSIKQNSNGTTTVIFDYQNVTAGKAINPFTISCTIGFAGTDHDVQNNQQLTATAQITSLLDSRKPTKARGTIADASITVVRLAALSVSKFVSPAHGNLGSSHTWTLNFGNSSQTDVFDVHIADVMPYVGDNRGTKFTGDYHIKKITLDLSKASRLKNAIAAQPIYYTSDASIRKDGEDKIVNLSTTATFKSLGEPTAAGDKLVWDNLDMTQEQLKAWRLDLAKMPGNEYISVIIDVSTSDADGNLYKDSNGKTQQPDDIYANTFAEYATGQAAIVHSNVVNTTVRSANITVSKQWKGDDGHTQFRPKTVIANVTGSDGFSNDVTLAASNNWTDTVKGLPYYDENGDRIIYTVAEPNVSNDYSSEVTGNADDGFTITNTYTYNAKGKIHLTAKKKITGREFENGDSMTFAVHGTVSKSDGEKDLTAPLDGTTVTISPTSGTEADIDFGEATIDSSFEGRTVTYQISETTVTGRGMSKDTSTKTVTFAVSDPNHDGTLTVKRSDTNGDIVFTNAFTPSSQTGSVTIKKTLTGRSWKDGETFPITITPTATSNITAEQAKAALPSGADSPSFAKPSSGQESSLTISGFTFKAKGVYRYEIKEKLPEGATNGKKGGMTYDTAAFIVSFNVTQDAKTGNLSVTKSMQRSDGKDTDTFTNRYTSTGAFIIKGTKTLNGRMMKEGEFAFELVDSNGSVIDTVTNKADGTFSFKKIDVSADDNGKESKYTVREKSGTLGGITYDTHICTVTATPTDTGNGTVDVKLVYSDGNAAKFVNSYNAKGTLNFDTLSKRVTGRSFLDGDSITFHLIGEVIDAADMKAPMPSNVDSNGNITIKPQAGQKQVDIALGHTSIASKYTGHTLRYTLTETKADAHGLSIDTSKKVFEFKVTDTQSNGHLTIQSTSPDNRTFTDSFTPDPIKISFQLKKQLNGRSWKANEKFDVDITARGSKSITETESTEALGSKTRTVSITAPQSGNETGSIDIPLTIKKPGTYVYEAVEKNAGQTKNGISYDGRKITIEVSVAQNTETDGKLYKTTTTYTTDKNEATDTFINNYSSQGSLDEIKVTKNLVGRKWKDSDKFQFRISAGDDATSAAIYSTDIIMPTNDTITVLNSNSHTTSFDSIIFKKSGTYRFDITELNHGIAGVDIAPKTTITVNAVDDGNGTIKCTVNGTSNIVFTDYYAKNEKVTVPINGIKTLSHNGYEKAPDITGRYTFAMKDANGNTIDTVTNGSNGDIKFSPLTYAIDDLSDVQPDETGIRTKTFTYTVSENGTIDGITNDTDKTFTVTLTDDGNGNLTASITKDSKGHAFSFTNTFAASATIPPISGTKTLKNAPQNNESSYSFKIAPADDETSKSIDNGFVSFKQGGTYQEVSCKAGEKFSFDEITATRPGTYKFKVSEIIPTDDKKAAGVEYDKTEYTMTYTVSENGTSTMDVNADKDNAKSCDFTNIYKAAGSIALKANKTIDGKTLDDGEFEFELRDENGNAISTTKNDANGNITFDKIEYGIEDISKKHNYTIVEKKGNEAGVTYDDKVISVDVTVSDNGDGTLLVDASYDGAKDTETFHNTYTKPTISDIMNDLVQTGVEALPYIAGTIICMIISLIAIKRRKRK